jgi:hypothetical protein
MMVAGFGDIRDFLYELDSFRKIIERESSFERLALFLPKRDVLQR